MQKAPSPRELSTARLTEGVVPHRRRMRFRLEGSEHLKQLIGAGYRNLQMNGGILLRDVCLDDITDEAELRRLLAEGISRDACVLGTTEEAVFRCVPVGRDPEQGKRPAAVDAISRDRWDVTLTGRLNDFSPAAFAVLMGSCRTVRRGRVTELRAGSDEAEVIPALCWVGDTVRGLAAVELKRALSTGGLCVSVKDKGTGSMPFSFRAHAADSEDGDAPCRLFFFDEAESE